MFSTCWFNTIFAYCLPFSHLLRIWDIFMLEGLKIVFRCGLVKLCFYTLHAEGPGSVCFQNVAVYVKN